MKKLFLGVLFLVFFSPAAFAFHLGPATPNIDQHEDVNLGAGYFFYQAEWDNVELEQNRGYLHLGYGMGIEDEPRWEVYLRAGAADLEDGSTFDSDFEPFGALGVKGAFFDRPYFGWGLVVQSAYFAGFDSNGTDFDHFWEIEAGFPFQTSAGPVIFYAGPVFYHAEADVKQAGLDKAEIEEDRKVGAFGGLGLTFGNVRLEAEAQYRSDFSVGGFLSAQF